MTRALFLACLLVAAGCTMGPAPRENWGELPAVPAGMANIHFLRPPSLAGSADWPVLLLNEQRVGILPSSTYTVLTMKPGAYKVSMEAGQGRARDWTSRTEIDVAAGRRYFILLEVESDPRDTAMTEKPLPLLPPPRNLNIRSTRWIHLDEAAGTDQARLLLYSPAPRQAP
jgi:hypothetical protein